MADSFSHLVERMDDTTARRFGQSIVINGRTMCAAEHAFAAEMAPLSGEGLSLIVFNRAYQPERHDLIIWRGKRWRLSRWQSYNDKPQIWIEEDNDAGLEASNEQPS